MEKTKRRLYSEDQRKVDHFVSNSINTTERNIFKPVKLIFWLTAMIILLGGVSRLIGVLILDTELIY